MFWNNSNIDQKITKYNNNILGKYFIFRGRELTPYETPCARKMRDTWRVGKQLQESFATAGLKLLAADGSDITVEAMTLNGSDDILFDNSFIILNKEENIDYILGWGIEGNCPAFNFAKPPTDRESKIRKIISSRESYLEPDQDGQKFNQKVEQYITESEIAGTSPKSREWEEYSTKLFQFLDQDCPRPDWATDLVQQIEAQIYTPGSLSAWSEFQQPEKFSPGSNSTERSQKRKLFLDCRHSNQRIWEEKARLISLTKELLRLEERRRKLALKKSNLTTTNHDHQPLFPTTSGEEMIEGLEELFGVPRNLRRNNNNDNPFLSLPPLGILLWVVFLYSSLFYLLACHYKKKKEKQQLEE